MPPNWISALIIAGWLSATGWLCYREFEAFFYTDTPPRFTPDIADEAITSPIPARWSVLRSDQKQPIGRASSSLRYRKETDTFELESTLTQLKLVFNVLIGELVAETPTSRTAYQVNREGRLVAFEAEGTFILSVFGFSESFDMIVTGEVIDDQLHSRVTLRAGGEEWIEEIEPLPLQRADVLNPLQPLPRIEGLTPGRRWRQPLFNPMGEAFRVAFPRLIRRFAAQFDVKLDRPIQIAWAESSSELLARVDDEPQSMEYGGAGRQVSCWVIRYREPGESDPDRHVGETWVEVESGKVLRQSMTRGGFTLELIRD